jgi:multidrug efflux pump subunit AcrA (membrane-fusion protein)
VVHAFRAHITSHRLAMLTGLLSIGAVLLAGCAPQIASGAPAANLPTPVPPSALATIPPPKPPQATPADGPSVTV